MACLAFCRDWEGAKVIKGASTEFDWLEIDHA